MLLFALNTEFDENSILCQTDYNDGVIEEIYETLKLCDISFPC